MKEHFIHIRRTISQRLIARHDDRILRSLSLHILRDIGLSPDNLRNELRLR